MDEKLVGVVVTTEHKGVFFGYVPVGTELRDGKITLQRARNCVYWSEAVHGFLGLAAKGPDNDSRVGPAVPTLHLVGVTSIAWVTDLAVASWEQERWG